MTVLATIGYEGAALEDFLATLAAARVTTLLDIREAPVSRRPGFSKRALAAASRRPESPMSTCTASATPSRAATRPRPATKTPICKSSPNT